MTVRRVSAAALVATVWVVLAAVLEPSLDRVALACVTVTAYGVYLVALAAVRRESHRG